MGSNVQQTVYKLSGAAQYRFLGMTLTSLVAV
jgi:hypothetical protein